MDSPPDSWYDPPEPKYEIEIKWAKPAPVNVRCDRCNEEGYMQGEIGDVRGYGSYFIYCKDHFDTAIEDTIDEIENYEPDYEED